MEEERERENQMINETKKHFILSKRPNFTEIYIYIYIFTFFYSLFLSFSPALSKHLLAQTMSLGGMVEAEVVGKTQLHRAAMTQPSVLGYLKMIAI